MSLPARFRDLPADAFPFTMELLDAETREVCWSATADGPGAVRVPSRDEVNGGRPTAARVTLGNGKVSVAEPEG
jgi:hypothetical protein